MTKEQVSPARLEEMRQTYSADVICMESKVRGAFEHRGKSLVCTGVTYEPNRPPVVDAYEIIPEALFQGHVRSYNEAGRMSDNGHERFSYHGVRVKFQGKPYVLTVRPEGRYQFEAQAGAVAVSEKPLSLLDFAA